MTYVPDISPLALQKYCGRYVDLYETNSMHEITLAVVKYVHK